jgi:hypothetical protein
MSDAKIRGVVNVIEDEKTFGQKGFRKRLVVLEEENGRFTNYIPIEFVQSACDTVDDLSVGDDVEITYRLGGRKWQKDPSSEVKYFLSAEAISFVVQGSSGKSDKPDEEGFDPAADGFTVGEIEDKDVPF